MTHNPDRKIINRKRRQLTEQERRLAAGYAKAHLNKLNSCLPKGAKVALYIDDFGELPTQPILDWCRRMRFKAYLPVVHTLGKQDKQLRFIPITQTHLANMPAVRHSFGMREPRRRGLIWAKDLDVIFCPLVMADLQGNRMGMGGGFYDTTLAKSYQSGRRKPLRIGWCYDFQVVQQLEAQPWDVPLHALITPAKLRWFSKNARNPHLNQSSTNSVQDMSSAKSVDSYLQDLEAKALITCAQVQALEEQDFSNDDLSGVINATRFNELLAQADVFITQLDNSDNGFE